MKILKILICLALSVISWYLLPIAIDIISNVNAINKLLGWLLICPIAFGFYLSSVITILVIIIKTILNKQWFYLTISLLIEIFNIFTIIYVLVK